MNKHYHFYYIKDLLGNIRETYVHPETGYKECIQRTQYYPSGLPWAEAMVPAEQPYKYNSKEFVEMHGLDEYDSEARWYYPAVCRTTTMDPLAEKYYSTSPYAWCGNNPVRFVDPEGMDIYDIDSTGTIVRQEENKEKDILWIVDKDKNRIDGKSIEFEYGTIKTQQNDSTTTLTFNTNQDGAKAFQFLADNSIVEYLLVTTLSNYSILTTQHLEGNVSPWKVIQDILAKKDVISIMIHNHPGNSRPSGFKKDDKRGDRFVSMLLDKITNNTIEYSVYQSGKQQVVVYDAKKIYPAIPANMYINSIY